MEILIPRNTEATDFKRLVFSQYSPIDGVIELNKLRTVNPFSRPFLRGLYKWRY